MLDLNTVEFWPQLNKLHLTFDDLSPVMRTLAESEHLETDVLGQSFLGNPIHSVTLGKGSIKILAWTQMHGDEPTATAAVMDVLSYLLSDPNALPLENFKALFTLKIIPMLNPDGAQAKTRYNAQGIDINRDAIALQSPEGQILRNTVNTFKPDIALNLHDQSPYYTVGGSPKPATIAFLAPAYNAEKSVNTQRKRAMQLIVGMRQAVEQRIPGSVARYDDEYSFRSFGDVIAGLGASTILIESGAHGDDNNRQVARRMNMISLLKCFELLSNNEHEMFSEATYFSIPENTENGLGDILIRKANIPLHNSQLHFKADILLKRRKSPDCRSYIEAIGDLSHLYGFEEIDGDCFILAAGRPILLEQPMTLDNERYHGLLQAGFTHFVGDSTLLKNQSSLPCLILRKNQQHSLMPNSDGYLLVYEEQRPRFAILDNTVVELQP